MGFVVPATKRALGVMVPAAALCLCLLGFGPAGAALAGDLDTASDADVVPVATSGVAATVNGEELPVSVLVAYIDSVRSGIGSQTDAAWEAYLADRGYTPDEYWLSLIEHYGREMCVLQRCDELGIEASDEAIEERVAQIQTALGIEGEDSDALWEAYLDMYGYTEASLRVNLAYQLRVQALYEQEVVHVPASGEVIQLYADSYAGSYASVQVGVIAFDSSDASTAKTVLDSLLADPDADFSDASARYNADDSLRARGGVVGWSVLAYLPESISGALESLEVGEVAPDLVYDGSWCYIVKVLDSYEPTYTADGTVDLADMPDELSERLTSDADAFVWDYECAQYLDALYAAAEVEVLVEHQYDVPGQRHG